ncbi:MAG: hypothetical protein ACMUHM_06610 [Thermoplasmatota archaeon]
MKRAGAPLFCLALVLLLASMSFPLSTGQDADAVESDVPTVSEVSISQETQFIKNMGQWDEEFEFVGTMDLGAVGLTKNGVSFNVRIHENKGQVVKYSFIDRNEVRPEGSDKYSHVSNFFLGNDPMKWKSSVPSFGTVTYQDLWDGIDLRYTSPETGLKYEYILEPGADPSNILIEVEGANRLTADGDELRILLENDVILRDSGLVVNYADGDRERIDANFREVRKNVFGFELEKYDDSRPVIIDPFLELSTFLGSSGTGDDNGGGFVRDASGNFYGSGGTSSTTFPTTTGVYDTTNNGWTDLVIFKLDPTLSSLVFSTYIGGSQNDQASALGLLSNGSVLVGGSTFSNDFPTSSNAYDTTYQPSGQIFGETDLVIARLDDNCSKLGFGTYLGVRMNETLSGIHADSSGNAIVIGTCESSGFPTTNDAYDRSHNGNYDIFITKINASGDKLLHSTFIGGSAQDGAYGTTMTSDDILYLTGLTRSSNFPTTSGAYDTTFNGGSVGYNSFVLKYNVSAGTVDLSTFLGTSYGSDIKIDGSGNIHISGQSNDNSFPTTTGAYQTTRAGQEDGVYSKFNPSGSQLLYSTYIGGSQWDSFSSVDVNSTGSVFLTGQSRSTNYPTTKGCYDSSHGGGWDVIVTRLDPQSSRLIYSTYIGGTSDESCYRLKVDGEDTAFIGGQTRSSTFPSTTGGYDPTYNGGYDIYFLKVNLSLVLLEPEKPVNLTGSMTDSTVNLRWEAPGDDGGTSILYYTIYRGLTQASTAPIDTTTDLFYDDTGLDISETYFYTVTATNAIGESLKHVIVSFHEEVPPTFNGDLTEAAPEPGAPLTITANFTDNVEVETVSVEYWLEGTHKNETMFNITGNDIWTKDVPIPDMNTYIRYRFYAKDVKNNWASTREFSRDIVGEVYPVLWNDRTPKVAAPSTDLIFSIDVRDNHRVDQVKVAFWVDGDTEKEFSMSRVPDTDTYTSGVTVPNVMDKNLHYFFRAMDNDFKWSRTMEKTIPIIDLVAPEFANDNSDREAETGSKMDFMISVTDNLYVKEVSVDYWINGGTTTTASLRKGTGDNWIGDFKVPQNALFISYRFKAMDPSANTNSTSIKMVNVTDVIYPVLVNDSSDTITYTGGIFTIKMRFGDNIGIKEARALFRFGEGDPISRVLSKSGDMMTGTLEVPVDEAGPLYYSVVVTDTSNRTLEVPSVEVPVIDNIPPTIESISDLTIYTGEDISITAEASDNRGVKTITWNGGPLTSSTLTYEGIPGNPGTFDIVVVVRDPGGNTASTGFRLTVLSGDHDSDGDGIPDLEETALGLDKDDHFDGLLDLDSDGLENWLEHAIGTYINDSDSDDDGMPDNWEFENGLDPLVSSATNDYDKDGFTDLQEFQEGTDPRISDKVEVIKEDYDATLLVILLIIFIILMIAVWTFAVIRLMKGRKQPLPEFPEHFEEERIDGDLDKLLADLPPSQMTLEPVPLMEADQEDDLMSSAPDEPSILDDILGDEPSPEEPPLGDEVSPPEEPVIEGNTIENINTPQEEVAQ